MDVQVRVLLEQIQREQEVEQQRAQASSGAI